MAARLCVGASLLITALTWRFHHVNLFTAGLLLFASLAIQGLVFVGYRVFIHPYWVSPMRHLPTPQVRHDEGFTTGLQFPEVEIRWSYMGIVADEFNYQGGHFFIGQMLNQIKTPGPADIFISWMRRWPDAPFVRYLTIGNTETLMVNSLAAFKEVQQTKAYSFRKSQLAGRMFSPITGHGLMFSEGDDRKRQRTQLSSESSKPVQSIQVC